MKRFTETTRWEKDWFISLSVKHKALWDYLTCKCDCAGVWDPNFKTASLLIGEPIEENDLHQMSGRVIKLECGKFLLPGFISFHYGKLSPDCPTHTPVYRSLEKHLTLVEMEGLSIEYHKGIQTLKYKKKEKEKSPQGGGVGEDADNAAIPSVAEVMAFGSMGAGIPADFCRHYHESKCIKRSWMNGYGRAIDWKREIKKWWEDSKGKWAGPKPAGNNEIQKTIKAKRDE
jgi:hypothetical protein